MQTDQQAARRDEAVSLALQSKPVLEVNALKTYFFTRSGAVKAVDGVSFALSRGETVPRSSLTGDGTVNERAVDVQINRLRRKIERDPANPLFLQAVRGIGYRLVASP